MEPLDYIDYIEVDGKRYVEIFDLLTRLHVAAMEHGEIDGASGDRLIGYMTLIMESGLGNAYTAMHMRLPGMAPMNNDLLFNCPKCGGKRFRKHDHYVCPQCNPQPKSQDPFPLKT